MDSIEQCKPNEKYLFAECYFSDNAIKIWQHECIKSCNDAQKGEAYDKFINWTRKENEIAVFTLYASANFEIPKNFDVIFNLHNPDEYIKINYQLSQSIFEAWLPLNSISAGHKHLCVFTFDKSLPDVFDTLYKMDEKFFNIAKAQKLLGFCNSTNFDEIKASLNQ